jgi:ribonucleoside-diphosphate reductase beta chain
VGLLTPRQTYAPFLYPKAYEYWELQQQSHWLPSEISMASDVNDWKISLSETEKQVIGHILKSFTQTEIFVQDYWSGRVLRYFKHPEVQMCAAAFASMESIHAVAYAYLNQSLGLEDFAAFLHEPTGKAKIDRLINVKGKSKRDIALSLAIFSAFNEGVNLFSSFAILLNFSRFNKLKGVGQIVSYSIKDESLHSDFGCYLFRTLVEENPELLDNSLKEELFDAARVTIDLEDSFIDKAFELGEIEGLTVADMKTFIRYRCNTKLGDIGLKKLWKNLDKDAIQRMNWFDVLSNSMIAHGDFFASRLNSYSKATINFDSIFD